MLHERKTLFGTAQDLALLLRLHSDGVSTVRMSGRRAIRKSGLVVGTLASREKARRGDDCDTEIRLDSIRQVHHRAERRAQNAVALAFLDRGRDEAPICAGFFTEQDRLAREVAQAHLLCRGEPMTLGGARRKVRCRTVRQPRPCSVHGAKAVRPPLSTFLILSRSAFILAES